jgi:hypothetical protein
MTNELQITMEPDDQQRTSATALMMNPEAMDRVMRMAELMASGKSTVPVHLQKNPADCLAVVLQATQWGLNPFAVAQKTHLVSGTLGYESQLVNAVVQQSGTISGRFHYEFKGNSPSTECRVGAVIRGESEITWGEWLNESKVTTKNSPLWKTNPKQQLGYLQVKNWARLYCPGAILGVYSPDEFDAPQPRNMGQAEVVPSTTPVADQSMLEAARTAADTGVAAYSAWWAAASKESRKAIGADEHGRLKADAVAADKARTVNSEPVTDAAPKPGRKTLAEVMAMLVAAKSLDALSVAGDWIGDLNDPTERKVAAEKFDELKFVLEMDAA